MNTQELSQLLKRDATVRQVVRGVFARDLLPTDVNYPSGYVCNTHTSSQPGEHWVAIFIDHDGVGEYFDSFGLPPLHASFEMFMNRNCASWSYNNRTLQSITSSVCGLYCIYFLVMRSKGYSLRDLLSVFTDNFNTNDDIVANLIQ